jgi:hypothetical protein
MPGSKEVPMWVFTRSGFFSVVKKPGCAPDELEVRARCRRDLEVLQKQTGVKSKILANAGTDYPFRIPMRREIWAKFLADEAMEIEYANFKDEVLFGNRETPRRRRHRHDVYFEVWRALLSLSETPGKRPRCSWRELEENLEDDQNLIEASAPDSSFAPPEKRTPARKPISRRSLGESSG